MEHMLCKCSNTVLHEQPSSQKIIGQKYPKKWIQLTLPAKDFIRNSIEKQGGIEYYSSKNNMQHKPPTIWQ